MQITLTHPNQIPEALPYLKGFNRVYFKPQGLQHFFTATRCDHCNAKAEEGDAVAIGCINKETADAFSNAMLATGQKILRAKLEPLTLWHNEETGMCVCSDCDNKLTAEHNN